MSPEEKLDLALRSYAAFSAGPDVEALIPLYDPACEWRIGARALDIPAIYTGHDGLRELAGLFREWLSAFKVTIEEARVSNDGRMMIQHRMDLTSAAMGVEISSVRWQEGEFTDHQILRVVECEEPPVGWDTAEPLKAIGLEEQAMSATVDLVRSIHAAWE